jgi:hypothetical protein
MNGQEISGVVIDMTTEPKRITPKLGILASYLKN